MSLPADTTVFADAGAVARAAAEKIRDLSHGGPVALCLSGGSTPQALYEVLAGPDFAGKVDWPALHFFFGDDRFVPHDHADSNYRMAREAMLDRVPAVAAQIHPMPTQGVTLEEGADAYERTLRDFYARQRGGTGPLFDLVLLGLGSDGHAASLFPGKPALAVTDRWVAGVPEAGLTPFVPRITLTFPAIASSREVLFLATGAGKRGKIAEIAAGADYPAGHVRSQGKVLWWIDRAAAGENEPPAAS